jgi:hypothetical protein
MLLVVSASISSGCLDQASGMLGSMMGTARDRKYLICAFPEDFVCEWDGVLHDAAQR